MQLRLLGPMAVIADGKALPLPASRGSAISLRKESRSGATA